MKLWKVERTDSVDWDEYAGFVIRAETEQDARQFASAKAGMYDPSIWFAESTQVTEIPADGETEIILSDFNAG